MERKLGKTNCRDEVYTQVKSPRMLKSIER